jgi:hypothetical protein
MLRVACFELQVISAGKALTDSFPFTVYDLQLLGTQHS